MSAGDPSGNSPGCGKGIIWALLLSVPIWFFIVFFIMKAMESNGV